MRYVVGFFVLVLACAGFAGAQTTLPARGDVITLMRRACDYELAAQAKSKAENGWVRAAFYDGVMAMYRTSHDAKYLEAATRWAEASAWKPHGEDLRNADNQACAQVYAELYLEKPEEVRIAASRAMFDAQIALPKRGREEWWWCDSLFMAPAGLARMSKATGDAKYSRFMQTMWWDTADYLFDKEAGLFFRDRHYFDAKTQNGKKTFWSRGNGWVVAGTVRVLDYLPDDWAGREKFVALHQRMCAAIAKLQGSDGLWRTSLLDAEQFPEPETSGSAFFCYAMAWGVNHGTLDRATYLPVVIRAWNGLCSKVNAEGRLGYVQKVAGGPGKVKAGDTLEYAVGGLLLAGSEVVKLAP